MLTKIHTAVLAAMGSAEAPRGAQVGPAVQNTTKEGITGPMPDPKLTTLSDGRTIGQVVSTLDKKDLKVAYEAADKCYDIQWGKDGIEELKGKLKTLENSVGEQVYKIARVAYSHCEGKLIIVRSYFLALCKQAEEHLTAKHTEATRKAGSAEEIAISKLIPQWPMYKSTIAKGLELGIDPDTRRDGADSPQYPTAAKYKAAVEETAKAAGTSENATGSQAGKVSDKAASTQLQVITSNMSPMMQAALSVLMEGIRRLTHEEQDKFAEPVRSLAAEIVTFANTAKREANGDHRTEAQRSAGPESTEELDPGTKAAMQAALDSEAAKDRVLAAEKAAQGATDSATAGKGGRRRGARAA